MITEEMSDQRSAVENSSVSLEGKVQSATPGRKVLAGYAAMAALTLLALLVARHFGSGLSAPPASFAPAEPAPPAASPHLLQSLLLALLAIVFLAQLAGRVCRLLRQPPVIGEVLAGILLGPSFLGHIAPQAQDFLFPDAALPALNAIAQLGIILFMFVIGLELNTRSLRERPHSTLAISHASIILPFLLGAMLAFYLYPRFASSEVSFTAFALFIGVSMSVTAFPVLARILSDRGLHRTQLGELALTCAAVNDVTAWCLLALVVGIIQSQLGGAVATILLTPVYLALMIYAVRPLLLRFVQRVEKQEGSESRIMSVLSVCLLLSCLAAEFIGIHALFGAFLLGAILPHESRVAQTMIAKLQDFVVVLLLPAFFALTGLRTQISLIDASGLLACLLIILVAFLGKFGGATVAARLAGYRWRDAAALGILMNTRGLVELIVLNVGVDLKVLSPRLFAMMVIMALVTTFMTSPILDWLLSRKQEDKKPPIANSA